MSSRLPRRMKWCSFASIAMGSATSPLEIPGGMIDPEDPDPAEAARREMREECGYDSSLIIPLGQVHPNPAIQPNVCTYSSPLTC